VPTVHLSAATPPGPIYWDPAIFQREMERLFFRNWLCIGREEQLAHEGDFLVRTIGPESLLFVRSSAGRVQGFYNVCRHRGTQLVTEGAGSGLKSIVCPYHSWTYSLDGKLVGATYVRDLVDFRREDHGLYHVRTEPWGGFIWANLDDSAPSLHQELGRFFDRYRHVPIDRLRLGGSKVYEVEANWKLLVENFSECYHCAPVHPNLNRITPYSTGDNDAYFMADGGHGKFSGGYMTFAGDYTSMTRSGYTKRPTLPGLTEVDRQRISYHVLFPNTFFSLHPDYLMIHRSWPISPSHSRVENEFYFDPEVMARPDFDPSDAVDIWDEINQQDWRVCELAQKGTHSRVWRGGRYSDQESLVCDFDLFVKDEMRQS